MSIVKEGRPLLVGVAVIVVRGGEWLLGLRKSADGRGTWGFAGGKLEPGESVLQAAARELAEETGLQLQQPRWAGLTEQPHDHPPRLTIYLQMDAAPDDQAHVLEPDKCERWAWFSRDALPQPLFSPAQAWFEQRLDQPGGFVPGSAPGPAHGSLA
jgi:8-oxo-dGTP diphosphatase